MDIILLESLNKLGKAGDIVTVKDGFAKNFLIPEKMHGQGDRSLFV